MAPHGISFFKISLTILWKPSLLMKLGHCHHIDLVFILYSRHISGDVKTPAVTSHLTSLKWNQWRFLIVREVNEPVGAEITNLIAFYGYKVFTFSKRVWRCVKIPVIECIIYISYHLKFRDYIEWTPWGHLINCYIQYKFVLADELTTLFLTWRSQYKCCLSNADFDYEASRQGE